MSLIILGLAKDLSQFFKIERGCKQGDPIAAYLFIICGQVLNYMITQNSEIKGFVIDSEEIKHNRNIRNFFWAENEHYKNQNCLDWQEKTFKR